MPIAPDQLPDDPQALKRLIAAMAQDALAAQVEIARLKFPLARYQRAEYGRSSFRYAAHRLFSPAAVLPRCQSQPCWN
jgi:hypothetical protein